MVRNQLLTLVFAFMLTGCIAQALTSGHIAFSDDSDRAVPQIGIHELTQIRDYCANHAHAGGFRPTRDAQGSHTLSGLRRYDTLPPDLAYRRLPTQLERRLQPLPQPYVRVLVGTDVLVINRRTRVITDLAHGACDPDRN